MLNQYNRTDRIKELVGRTERCCCRYCGSSLELKRITFSHFEDSRIEIFCTNCGRIEYGVEPEIYLSAKYFVEHFDFNWYTYLDDSPQTREVTVAKICDILVWQNRQLGFLDNNGFKVPVKIEKDLLGECMTISDKMLEEIEIEE